MYAPPFSAMLDWLHHYGMIFMKNYPLNKMRHCLFIGYLGLYVFFIFSSLKLMANPPGASIGAHNHSGVDWSNVRFKSLNQAKLDLVGGLWDIVEDRYGFIWFAGSGGVARYDGYDLKIYRNNPQDDTSLTNNYATDLLVDKAGNLWIGTRWGLNRYDYASDTFTQFKNDPKNPKSLRHNFVWKIIEGQEGELWLATGGGLNRFVSIEKGFQQVNGTDADGEKGQMNASLSFVSIHEDKNGLLWLGSEGEGLFTYDKKTGLFKNYKHNEQDQESIPGNEVLAIAEDSKGKIWVGTGSGMALWNKNSEKFSRFVNDPKDVNSISGNIVRDIKEDAKGNLWVAVDGGGVNVYKQDSGGFYRFVKSDINPNGLLNNKVRVILEDSAGGMWFGHFPSGVSQLDKYASAFKNYEHNPLNPNSIGNSDILSAIEDYKGNFWVGTEQGLNYINRQTQEVTRYHHDPMDETSIPANPVIGLYEDSKKQIWVGTYAGGFAKYNPETKAFVRSEEFKQRIVRNFYEDSQGDIWIAYEKGVAKIGHSDGKLKYYVHDEANSKSFLRLGSNDFLEDSKGDFWVAGDTGIARMDRKNETFERFENNPKDKFSIGEGYFQDLFEDSSGNIWILSGATGVNLLDKQTMKFYLYQTPQGLADDIVGGVLEGGDGHLWFSTGSGISRFDPKTKRFIKTYTQQHGLAGNMFKKPAAVKTKFGELAFGSTKGFSVFNPNDIPENARAPQVKIIDFQIFYKPVSIEPNGILAKKIIETDAVTLSYKESVFSFEFTALNYFMPDNNQYSYKMEGFDADWVNVGNRRVASYTNLNAGSYVFKVKASNNEGVWNEAGTSVKVTILPPPWKTWWAYMLYATCVLLLLANFLYSQWKKRNEIERQNRYLEKKVAERTFEIQQKNNDIQALLSNMRQGLFTIQDGGIIHPEYSKYLEEIFECKSIAGKRAMDFLFSRAKLSGDAIEQVGASLDAVIGEPEFNYDVNCHLLISEFSVDFEGRSKHLSLDWNPILAGDTVEKLMVTVRDVTEIVRMEQEAGQKKKELDIISQIIKVPNVKFLEFEKSTRRFIQENKESIIACPSFNSEILALMFRNMHTIKGNCRTFNFKYLSDAAHDAESIYSRYKNAAGEAWDVNELLESLVVVESVFSLYLDVFYNVLCRADAVDSRALLTDKTLKKVFFAMNYGASIGGEKSLIDAKTMVNELLTSTLKEVISDILLSLPSIAESLGKLPPRLQVTESNVRILNDFSDLMVSVFSHILRNCVDHGIECASERNDAGKPAEGTIYIDTVVLDGCLEIQVWDDGRGINVGRLFQKGVELGFWGSASSPNLSEIAQLIFVSGVSTKEQVSDISGRGVGMDAVKTFLVNNGGDISIRLPPNTDEYKTFVPFKSVITLPANFFIST